MADNLEIRRATTSVSVDIYDQTYQSTRPRPGIYSKAGNHGRLQDARGLRKRQYGDSLRVAVLAAINIADELARLQEHCRLSEAP